VPRIGLCPAQICNDSIQLTLRSRSYKIAAEKRTGIASRCQIGLKFGRMIHYGFAVYMALSQPRPEEWAATSGKTTYCTLYLPAPLNAMICSLLLFAVM